MVINMSIRKGVYSRKQFHIKNKIFVVVCFAVILSECGSIKTETENDCPDSATDPLTYVIDSRGQFCNDDTYIMKAAGLQDNKANVPDEKKSRARRNAILEAQYKLLEVFLGDRIETWSPMYEPPAEYLEGQARWKKDIVALVKNGTVLAESYDSALNCTILYVIKKKHLKQMKDIPFENYTGDEK